MTEHDGYCDFCELPLAQCIHGRPPAPPPPTPVATSAPKPRKRAVATSRTAGTSVKPLARRWTQPEALKPHILSVLQQAGGELQADELFLELEILVEDRLLPGDRERTPEGEPRWQYAARRARVALVNEGLMVKGVPGMWTLSKAR
jgi:hypothetical protein